MAKNMLLAFDVGNTNIVLGVFDDGQLIQNWRMETLAHRSADEYGMTVNQLFDFAGLKFEDVGDVIISTVVPSVLYTLQHMAQKYFDKKALIVGQDLETGLKIKYDDPNQVGADRIVNAVAALDKYGGPLLIVDLGTATTFCAMTSDWQYLGGAIAPGIKISSDALYQRTAKLPRIELEEPKTIIAKNTIDSMKSGLVYGHRAMVSFIVDKMKEELLSVDKSGDPVKVIATGGVADLMQSGLDCIDYVDKQLTLEGLNFIYNKNKKATSKKGKNND